MKKYVLTIVCILALALLAVCVLLRIGQGARPAAESPAAEASADGESAAGMPNPMRESSMEELRTLFGVELRAPAGAEEVAFYRYETDPPLGEMVFARGGASCSCRVAAGDALRDISGMYYDWETTVVDSEHGLTMNFIPGGAGVAACFSSAEGRIFSLSVSSGADKETLRALFEEVFGARLNASDGLAEELCAQFDRLRSVCFPGTAGSSLSSAACAAEMADFFLSSGIGPDAVRRTVQSYRSALAAEDAQLFETQLESVVGAFGNLTGENGRGLLEDCGYESSGYPWDSGTVRACFDALLGG